MEGPSFSDLEKRLLEGAEKETQETVPMPDDEDMPDSAEWFADINEEPCSDGTMQDLFRMVFQAAQKPDSGNKKLQKCMTIVLTVVLCVQVVWALFLITTIVFRNQSIAGNALTFITLLVSAILAEVVAMAFVVVRFVFRTPLDMMIDLLREIIAKQK